MDDSHSVVTTVDQRLLAQIQVIDLGPGLDHAGLGHGGGRKSGAGAALHLVLDGRHPLVGQGAEVGGGGAYGAELTEVGLVLSRDSILLLLGRQKKTQTSYMRKDNNGSPAVKRYFGHLESYCPSSISFDCAYRREAPHRRR